MSGVEETRFSQFLSLLNILCLACVSCVLVFDVVCVCVLNNLCGSGVRGSVHLSLVSYLEEGIASWVGLRKKKHTFVMYIVLIVGIWSSLFSAPV